MIFKIFFSLMIIFSTFSATQSALKYAYFAGGCFWCMEKPFDKRKGVSETISGYIGGTKKNATYRLVSSGSTKHIESIRVKYDPKEVTYKELLNIFWKQINPTDAGGQFVDRGHQYISAIFYENKKEMELAKKTREKIKKIFLPKSIVTEIIEMSVFYPAEDYHQDYYKINPLRYKYYRYRSGRDQFLEKYWN